MIYCQLRWTVRARIALLTLGTGAVALTYGQVTTGPVGTQPVTTAPIGIQQGGSVVGPGDLPVVLASLLQTMGNRLTTSAMAQIHLVGTTTDASGTRSAQITIQAPGQFSYTESQGKTITFNGKAVQTNSGAATVADQPIVESLLADFPDMVILQAANGGGFRKVATHARTDDGTSAVYAGPFWTVLEFAPGTRSGLTWGQPLQQELFICVDEKTRLISEVRRAVRTGPASATITQTQFQNWFQQGSQWFPGKIVRLDSGVQTLSFQVQTATTGVASAVTAFQP